MRPSDEHHDLPGVHDSAHAHSQSLLGDSIQVAAEETGVGNDRVLELSTIEFRYPQQQKTLLDFYALKNILAAVNSLY